MTAPPHTSKSVTVTGTGFDEVTVPAPALANPPLGVNERIHRPRPWYRIPDLMVGLAIVAVLLGLSLAAPLITSYSPTEIAIGHVLAGPSGAHWLGTDELGRDIWTRILYAGRIDIVIGITAVIPPFVIGVVLGTIAGYRAGPLEAVIMRVSDVVMAFPFYVLVAALVFAVGTGVRGIYIAVAIVTWASYARIMHGQIRAARNSEYVQAARASGLSTIRILTNHMLRNTIGQAVVYAVSDMVIMILSVVTLSYLGLGIAPPSAEWGSMISEGQPFLASRWIFSTAPGIAVVLIGIGLGLIGDGLSRLMQRETS